MKKSLSAVSSPTAIVSKHGVYKYMNIYIYVIQCLYKDRPQHYS